MSSGKYPTLHSVPTPCAYGRKHLLRHSPNLLASLAEDQSHISALRDIRYHPYRTDC